MDTFKKSLNTFNKILLSSPIHHFKYLTDAEPKGISII